MSSQAKFQCSACGQCCQSVPKPLAFEDGGKCQHLREDLRCGIYMMRPEECRVDSFYESTFSALMTREAYYRATNQACNQLIKNANLPDSYLIQIGA